MTESEEVEEVLDEADLEEKSPQAVKRKINVIEKELKNTSDLEWVYSKQLLKVGMATWIFGICTFVAAVILYKGPHFILNAPPISKALLIAAGAAPIIITVIFIQSYRRKVNRLKRIRKQLLSIHEKGLLKKVEDDIE